MSKKLLAIGLVFIALMVLAAGCGGKTARPPAVTSGPASTTMGSNTSTSETPRPRPPEPPTPPPVDSGEDLIRADDPLGIMDKDLDSVNDLQPLEDVHFNYDSAVLEPAARSTLDDHAQIMEQYPGMTILIEGHCDERGTVEYNLALGERRANSVYNYLMSLGIAGTRMRTITYGKEFPLDPAHNEQAWARNRRARFEITAK